MIRRRLRKEEEEERQFITTTRMRPIGRMIRIRHLINNDES